MTSVGAFLRELRTDRGVPLDEIARRTRVAMRYLEALEADAFDALPAPVFTRGFIRAYCQALAEPPDEVLACYDRRDGRAPQPAPRPGAAARAGDSEPRTRGAIMVSFVLLVVLGMALFTVALLIRPREGAERSPATRPDWVTGPSATSAPPLAPAVTSPPAMASPSVTAAIPPPTSEATVPQPAAAASATAPAGPSRPVPPPAAPARPVPLPEQVTGRVTAPYRLVARMNEATWIRVRTEDGRTSEENVPAGEVREWVSDRPFVLTIGNAGGVSFELNGRVLPPLGARGVVIPHLVIPPESR